MVNLREEEVTSSSSFAAATPRWKHDVFLSFRGKDTRKNFTDHLYIALIQRGINTFLDDEKLNRGKLISPELLKAIEESRFAIIVFSRNYADSTWCLDELAQIVKCMKLEMGLTVFPVFYDVDPFEVRKQTGTFAKAFAKHEQRFKENREKVETWRDALREVANISGFHLGERNEAMFIQDIVKSILKKLHHTFQSVMEGLVGIKHQVEELKRLICIGSNDVRVIGISGMGGIGKTTLAKVVCSIFSDDFESCIFINVSKESNLVRLQQQLLCQILNEKDVCIWNVERGVNMINNMLHNKKNLLVLDDVNHLDQLKCLVGQRNWFGFGSRIIITTRDAHLLKAHNVDAIHKCKKLYIADALELLCLKAFKKKQPEKGYEGVSQEIVDYANGLPIALDVLGCRLVGKPINHWEDVLKRLKEYPDADIVKTLEISYDGLNNEAEKMIFIYIACFLKGMNRGLVTDILESFNLYPTSGIDVLIDRSLITISKNNIVLVHDLLQEMGWEILRRQSPAEPGNRIWHMKQEWGGRWHMKQEWGGVIGTAAYREWQSNIASKTDPNNLKQGKQKTLMRFLSLSWPFSWIRSEVDDSSKQISSLPVDSVMAWYLAPETGKFWFPAQVYNSENGHVGFMLSCYDAELSHDPRTDTFQVRYPPHGGRAIAPENGVPCERLRAPPVDTSPHDLHITDCLNELCPGDHIEIQWRRIKESPYGWWYGVVGHWGSCDGDEYYCRCHNSDGVVLEFNQYTPGSWWRRAIIGRKDHREEGNEADGFYGGIRKLKNKIEISTWKLLWPTEVLE